MATNEEKIEALKSAIQELGEACTRKECRICSKNLKDKEILESMLEELQDEELRK